MVGGLDRILKWIKGTQGTHCEKLVRLTARDITISGVKFGLGNVNVQLGGVGLKSKVLRPAAKMADELDTNQYLLCDAIRQGMIPKKSGGRIRLMVIMANNHLGAILSSIEVKSSKDIEKELVKWLKYMGHLTIKCNNLIAGRMFREPLSVDAETKLSSLKMNVDHLYERSYSGMTLPLDTVKRGRRKTACKKKAHTEVPDTYVRNIIRPRILPSYSSLAKDPKLAEISEYLGVSTERLTQAVNSL